VKNDDEAKAKAMREVVSLARSIYEQSYKLLQHLGHCVRVAKAGIEPMPGIMWEPAGSQDSDSCVRARLAQWYVPSGSLVEGSRRDEPGQEGARHHLRLRQTNNSVLFITIEFYRVGDEDSVQLPGVFYGIVSDFSGRFRGKGAGEVQIHRGDLASILASADLRQVGSRQRVHGKVHEKTAYMVMRSWSPLAVFKGAHEIEDLAKAIVAAWKDPSAIARGQ
jgi:hypothetical protein